MTKGMKTRLMFLRWFPSGRACNPVLIMLTLGIIFGSCSERPKVDSVILESLPKRIRMASGLEMVLIKGGPFTMGSLIRLYEEAASPRKAEVGDYYIARWEICKAVFRKYADDKKTVSDFPELNPGLELPIALLDKAPWYRYPLISRMGSECEERGYRRIWNISRNKETPLNWRPYQFGPGEDFPMCFVTRQNARSFATWLGKIDHAEYRLPLEAEWEYAARAGSRNEYWWGNRDCHAITDQHGCSIYEMYNPAGVFPGNPFGLYDMYSNAKEWCDDGPDFSKRDPNRSKPMLRTKGSDGILRGGDPSCDTFQCGNGVPEFRPASEPWGGIRIVLPIRQGFVLPEGAVAIDEPPVKVDGKPPYVVQKLPTTIVSLGDTVQMELVQVPVGSFVYGAPIGTTNVSDGETFGKTVRMTRTFSIGRHEVSQEQFESIMGRNPSKNKGPKRPVDSILQDDAYAFCDKLTKREREAGRLGPDESYRLPFGFEWEYAYRAGTDTSYFWGEDEKEAWKYGWIDRYSHGTADVGGRFPNAWGLYDMTGNISEYAIGQEMGRLAEHYDEEKMSDSKLGNYVYNNSFYGGSYLNLARGCQAYNRHKYRIDEASLPWVGFRVVRGLHAKFYTAQLRSDGKPPTFLTPMSEKPVEPVESDLQPSPKAP